MPKHIIFGAPGTGKTTRLLDIIDENLKKGILPSQICFCTFSRAGANEAKERAVVKFGFDKKDVLYFGTIHSLCYKQFCIGRELVKKARFFKEINIEYQETEEDMDSIINNDFIKEAGNVIISFYDKLRLYFKKGIASFTQEQLVSSFYSLPMTEGDYDILFGGTFDVYQILKNYEEYKTKEELIDFVDMLLWVYNEKWIIPAQILIVDEFQDLSPLQYEIYKIWAENKKEVYIAGDDDQCLFGETKIQTDTGIKNIKDLTKKDKIISNFAAGKIRAVSILKLGKQKCNKKCLEIKTLKGNIIRCTENHHFFATLTNQKKNKGWYIYLMEKEDNIFRIGISKNPAIRKNFERGLVKIVPIKFVKSLNEALAYEEYFSIKYGISKRTFTPRSATDKEINEKLFQKLKEFQKVEQLLKEVNKTLEESIWIKSVVRGKTNRKTVNLCCLYSTSRERKTPYYTIILETGSKRERFDFQDYLITKEKARELAEKEDAQISERWSFGKKDKNNKFFKIKAMNLIEGMKVPSWENGKIEYDEIVSIKSINSPEFVYDIEVEGTHNYCAENIFVSNTIYTFICANSKFLLEERQSIDISKGDEETILDKTYRLPKQIHEYCLNFIRKNIRGQRVDKDVVSLKEGGEVIEENINENLERIFDFIRKDKSTFVLFRTNYYKNQFIDLLIQKGMVYEEIRGQGIWNNKTINLFNASVKLMKHQPLNYEETKYLIENIPYKLGLLKKGLKSHFKDTTPEQEYSFSKLLQLGLDMSFFNYFNYKDIYDILDVTENARKMFFETKKEIIQAPIKIKIGTIHSAKGKEAEDTVILKDIPFKIAQEMSENNTWDNEIRVFLVGISRSRERLIMLRGGFPKGDMDIIP